MSTFAARYFDGRSSVAREVEVRVSDGDVVLLDGEDVAGRFPRAEVRVSARLGNAPRYLYLPDGSKCETDAHEAVDAALAGDGGGIVHALERRWGMVLAAVVFTGVFLFVGVQYGLPFLARQVAHAIPPAMEAQMGQQSLEAMDAAFLEGTRLLAPDRERVRGAFERIKRDLDLGPGIRLELRSAEDLGANAFALPSGIVVMTDEMVELARSDEELMGVLAHELGHVEHRHIMRSILQNSAAALLVAALLGDITSVAGLAASIPTFLLEQQYSRSFEYEADAYALAWMRDQGIDTAHFAAILERLAEEHGGDVDGITRYLSTHPSMKERIAAIRDGPR